MHNSASADPQSIARKDHTPVVSVDVKDLVFERIAQVPLIREAREDRHRLDGFFEGWNLLNRFEEDDPWNALA